MKGEFEKRINKYFEEGYSGIIGELHGGEAEDVLKVIDEARRECPLNPLVKAIGLYTSLKNHTKEQKHVIIMAHLNNCNLKRFILEEIDWFVKWFGVGESERAGTE